MLISGGIISFSGIVCAQAPIPCGQTMVGSISVPGEIDSYTFSLSETANVTIRGWPTTGAPLALRLELYDSLQTLIEATTYEIRRTLGAGAYILKARDINNQNTGFYAVFWQNWNNLCNATPITCGQTLAGSISFMGETDFFSFTAAAGDTLALTLTPSQHEGNPYEIFHPNFQLHNDLGNELAYGYNTTGDPITIYYSISTTGTYSLLVLDNDYMHTWAYTVKVQKNNNSCPQVTVTAPRGGEFLQHGSTFPITWTSTDAQGITSHEIRLSTDGGLTFPTVIVTGLGGTVHSFDWNVPTGVSTARARIRVIATDTSGMSTVDDSDSDFVISQGVKRTYLYDQLNRLIQVIHEE